MRLLTFTTLYPSEDRPRHGIFVAERLRQLVASGGVTAQVIALRPSASGFFGANSTAKPRPVGVEDHSGIAVHYVNVPTIPALTNWIDPWLWAGAAEAIVKAHRAESAEETILDGHYLYPDGVAAALIGRRLGIPTVITARGSDVNVKGENPVMRRWMRWAGAHCAAIITVSRALAERLSHHRIEAPIVEVLPNGVDLRKFRQLDRTACRARYGASGRVIVSVGHLLADKGHHIAIEALARMPREAMLLIVGTGPQRDELGKLAERCGVVSRVRFLGLVDHEDMPAVYNAADVLALPSVREGMPNVILESLACGTPVVATNVGGIGEVVTSPVAGELMPERTAGALSAAVAAVAARCVSSAETRAFAEQFGWGRVVERQLDLYRTICATFSAREAARA
jgi:teichuronic acid biosynthesis glycosyltransferase TuaC